MADTATLAEFWLALRARDLLAVRAELCCENSSSTIRTTRSTSHSVSNLPMSALAPIGEDSDPLPVDMRVSIGTTSWLTTRCGASGVIRSFRSADAS